MAETGGRGPITGINVTPLVDITLVLLIILMVTAKIVATPAIPLDLPHASHTEDIQVVLSVIVPARGRVLINGEPVGDDERLRELVEQYTMIVWIVLAVVAAAMATRWYARRRRDRARTADPGPE